jgi:hypothetical protein
MNQSNTTLFIKNLNWYDVRKYYHIRGQLNRVIKKLHEKPSSPQNK